MLLELHSAVKPSAFTSVQSALELQPCVQMRKSIELFPMQSTPVGRSVEAHSGDGAQVLLNS